LGVVEVEEEEGSEKKSHWIWLRSDYVGPQKQGLPCPWEPVLMVKTVFVPHVADSVHVSHVHLHTITPFQEEEFRGLAPDETFGMCMTQIGCY
jgi:hypothetical protein